MLSGLKEKVLALSSQVSISGRSATTDPAEDQTDISAALLTYFFRMPVHFIYSKNSVGNPFVPEHDLNIKSLFDSLVNN